MKADKTTKQPDTKLENEIRTRLNERGSLIARGLIPKDINDPNVYPIDLHSQEPPSN